MDIFETLLHQSKSKISHNAKVRFSPGNKVNITLFNQDVFIESGWEQEKKGKGATKPKDTSNPQRQDSLRRAKNCIYEIAAANTDWKYFVTLTLDAEKLDRYNAKAIVKPFTKWLQNQASRNDLKYLVIPEKHKDGAIHFHGLFNDKISMVDSGTVKIPTEKQPVMQATAKRKGVPEYEWKTVYNIEKYPFGFSSALLLDSNIEAVSRYVTKYITKDMQKIFGKSYFAGGKGLKRQLPFELLDLEYDNFDCKEYKVDGGRAVKYLTFALDDYEEIKRGIAI